MIPQNRLQKPWGIATAFRVLILLSLLAFLAAPSVSYAAFPGTNGKIAFESTRDSSFGQIYVMNPDGTGVTRLTFTAAHDGYPVWSPDGTKIVFESTRSGDVDIYVMNADGTGQTQLTTDPAVDNQATWSPDGAKIVFGTRRSGVEDIYVMNADGTGQINLTNHPAIDTRPDWSPDGTKIAFESNRNGFPQIFVMNADGTNVTQLTTLSRNGGAAWSPDGIKIAFFSDRDCGGCGTYFDIYSMNADGTGQTRLSFDPVGASDPAWSPDGTKIVFDSRRDGNYEVYVMNADGTGQTNITNHAAVDFRANWGPMTLLDPCQELEHISDSLQAIIDDNPGTPLADKLEDALAKTQSARTECAKTPPDNQAAVGNIEGAVADLEAVVKDGLLNPGQGTQLMDELAAVAMTFAVNAIDEAIAQGGDSQKINEAQQALASGDVLRASGKFKEAVNQYKDALSKAESALP